MIIIFEKHSKKIIKFVEAFDYIDYTDFIDKNLELKSQYYGWSWVSGKYVSKGL